jgi:hypothetical protein
MGQESIAPIFHLYLLRFVAFITQIVSFVFDFVRFSFIVDTRVSNSQIYVT